MVFVGGHGQHVGHSLVHTFNASVSVCLVGDCSKLARSQKPDRQLVKTRTDLGAIVLEYGELPLPEDDPFDDQDVGRAFRGELWRRDGKSVCSTTETLFDEQDVGTSPRLDQTRHKIIDAE